MKDIDLEQMLGGDIQQTIDYVENIISRTIATSQSPIVNTQIAGCNINIGQNMDLNFDFLELKSKSQNYALLIKIQQIKALLNDINNALISAISKMECCGSDQEYNKMVVPILRWIAEDENGFCGTLLRFSKELLKIYIPIKNMLCIFRPVPGNPTLKGGGADFLKAIYSTGDGLEKVNNLLNNGDFLNPLIYYIQRFRDMLLSCVNGTDVSVTEDWESTWSTLTGQTLDEITFKEITDMNAAKSNVPKFEEPVPEPLSPNIKVIDSLAINSKYPIPQYSDYNDLGAYREALTSRNKKVDAEIEPINKWNEAENQRYQDELLVYKDYKKRTSVFKEYTEKVAYNSKVATSNIEASAKAKHKALCGCMGKMLGLDGIYFPEFYIIRTEADIRSLIGRVSYKGSTANYKDKDDNFIDIIKESSFQQIRDTQLSVDYEESLKYLNVNGALQAEINSCSTIGDVINLNKEFERKRNFLVKEKKRLIRNKDKFLDEFRDLFQAKKKNIIKEQSWLNLQLSRNKINYITFTHEMNLLDTELSKLAYFPPQTWDASFDPDVTVNGITLKYSQLESFDESIKDIDIEIADLETAIGRNHSYYSIVDASPIECNCDIICQIVNYFVTLVNNLIKKIIQLITDYLLKSILGKETQWWISFIRQKIQCLVELKNMPKTMEEMEKKFETEMNNKVIKEMSAPPSCIEYEPDYPDEGFDRAKPEDPYEEPDPEDPYDDGGDGNDGDNDPTTPIPDPDPEVTDPTFTIIKEDVTEEENEWPNRVIPPTILDCTKDYSYEIKWVPKDSSFSVMALVTIDIDQFIGDSPVVIESDEQILTDEMRLAEAFDIGLQETLIAALNGQDNELFKIVIGDPGEEIICIPSHCRIDETTLIIDEVKRIEFSTINQVWFKEFITGDFNYIKTYDRFQQNSISDLNNNWRDVLTASVQVNKDLTEKEYEIEPQPSNKLCGSENLVITTLEPVYNFPDLDIYPGEVTLTEEEEKVDGEWIDVKYRNFSARLLDDGTHFQENNIPYKVTVQNASGIDFTAILTIDWCSPSNVQDTPFDIGDANSILGGRYQIIDYKSLPNNQIYKVSDNEIMMFLLPILQKEGLASDTQMGASMADYSANSTTSDIKPSLNDKLNEELTTIMNRATEMEEESQSLDTQVQTNINELSDVLNNGMFEDLESFAVNPDVIDLSGQVENKTNKKPMLGIPIMVLNEEKNIILTIKDKKLALINLNYGTDTQGLSDWDLVIDVPIDYREGEQLLIGYQTNGIEHTISWVNQRKQYQQNSMIIINDNKLIPTRIGSIPGVKKFCGRLLDLILSDTNNDIRDWYNEINTNKPFGTIGFYDFSLFNGYHVYSIPEKFRVESVIGINTIKGLMYKNNPDDQKSVIIAGERPITVSGDFNYKNDRYYKNVSYGTLDNFFCRDNLLGKPFTISVWLKKLNGALVGRDVTQKQYIFSDTHNGNYIWYDDINKEIHFKFRGRPEASYPCMISYTSDLVNGVEDRFKWFQHIFRYNKNERKIEYWIIPASTYRDAQIYDPDGEDISINDGSVDINYPEDFIKTYKWNLPLIPVAGEPPGLDFSLVTMLARFSAKDRRNIENFWCEVTALAIWPEYKDDAYINKLHEYQRLLIS